MSVLIPLVKIAHWGEYLDALYCLNQVRGISPSCLFNSGLCHQLARYVNQGERTLLRLLDGAGRCVPLELEAPDFTLGTLLTLGMRMTPAEVEEILLTFTQCPLLKLLEKGPGVGEVIDSLHRASSFEEAKALLDTLEKHPFWQALAGEEKEEISSFQKRRDIDQLLSHYLTRPEGLKEPYLTALTKGYLLMKGAGLSSTTAALFLHQFSPAQIEAIAQRFESRSLSSFLKKTLRNTLSHRLRQWAFYPYEAIDALLKLFQKEEMQARLKPLGRTKLRPLQTLLRDTGPQDIALLEEKLEEIERG